LLELVSSEVVADDDHQLTGMLGSHPDSNKLRLTRSAISSADVTSEISLGVEGEPFKFSQCVNQVSTALNGQVEEVERFIREQVKP
jgi:hypothetical protein